METQRALRPLRFRSLRFGSLRFVLVADVVSIRIQRLAVSLTPTIHGARLAFRNRFCNSPGSPPISKHEGKSLPRQVRQRENYSDHGYQVAKARFRERA